jgi:hypothetical protein
MRGRDGPLLGEAGFLVSYVHKVCIGEFIALYRGKPRGVKFS